MVLESGAVTFPLAGLVRQAVEDANLTLTASQRVEEGVVLPSNQLSKPFRRFGLCIARLVTAPFLHGSGILLSQMATHHQRLYKSIPNSTSPSSRVRQALNRVVIHLPRTDCALHCLSLTFRSIPSGISDWFSV